MKCSMPLCENTSENSKCGRITFHGFPRESCLRAAWLRALGTEDSQLPDSAVVCSQHFLHDDICETENGSRQLRTGSVPSTVLVCMICLDTDGKMSPISQYNLEAAYEKLTGHPLWDGGNLKQTLCVQCAHRLRNFSTFREQSLRARSLMMELLVKHELITIQHIRMIQHANYKLSNNLVATTLGPDPCDMYIVEENSDEGRQDSEETELGVAVKTELSDDSQWEDEDTLEIMIDEKGEFTTEMYESAVFMCTVCCEEFPHEHAYSAHVCMHLHSDAHPAAPSADSEGNTIQHSERALVTDRGASDNRALVTDSGASDNRARDSDHRTNTGLKSCVVKLCDILKYPESAKIKVESSPPKLQAACSRDSLNVHTACGNAQDDREDEVTTTHNKPVASLLSEMKPGTSGLTDCVFTQKDSLVGYMRTHTGEKPYFCKICSYKCAHKGALVRHMRIHTGEKPYSCKICSYKCAVKGSLVRHMRTHTGEKPYSCETCSYKFTSKGNLVKHMRIHTGEKPYSCKICSYKCAVKGSLVRHMRTHTGEKPYSCETCSYKFTSKSNLVTHMRIHTGEKPYSCKICRYKCAIKAALVKHMRTHTGEKPYFCMICSYKCAHKGALVRHMRIHTGEKPYSCKICSYKCAHSSNLTLHMTTHTGEKRYSCDTCSYKFTSKGNLVTHMRTHTGEKPYSCKICSYKCAYKGYLVKHIMRIHMGEKPYSCKICSYKCARSSTLTLHMRTHTGEKRYSCKICTYKCAIKGALVKHMRTHW